MRTQEVTRAQSIARSNFLTHLPCYLLGTVGAAYSGHLYSGQPLRVDDLQSTKEQINNTEAAGYNGQPLLVGKSARSRGVHCKRRPLYSVLIPL